MRRAFLRAVLLAALAVLALAVAKQAWAEKLVMTCTSTTEPSPLRVEKDTESKTVLVEDATRSTRDLYPLNNVSDWSDAPQLESLLGGKYQCRPAE